MDKKDFFALLSLLLDYPDNETYNIVKEKGIELTGIQEVDSNLKKFLDFYRVKSLNELQEYYVATLDFGKDSNFYLTYHRFKNERKRGEALAQLKEIYWSEGFDIKSNELPDYLPLILEFTAVVNYEKGLEILDQYLPELEKIKEQLKEKQNPYFYLLEALTAFLKNELVKNLRR
jgi:nitrate reductase delta subunit